MEEIKLDDYEEELVGIAKEIQFYLQKSGAPYENAKDISQDIFVAMLESENVLPYEKMRAWMYRVAVRKYIDTYRRDKKYLDILQRDFFKKENIIVFEQVDYEPLYNVIQRLTPKYRMVLDLYYFQELSVKEISQVLHASQSKIKTNLMRGRRLVRGILEKEGYNYEDFK